MDKKEILLLLEGFVRTNIIFKVPKEIILLCFKFYWLRIPNFKELHGCEIDYKHALITTTTDNNNINAFKRMWFVSTKGWNKGIHKIEIKILQHMDGAFSIGLISNKNYKNLNKMRWLFTSSNANLSYQLYHHQWISSGFYHFSYGNKVSLYKIPQANKFKLKSNDILSIIVNCNDYTLQCYYNKKEIELYEKLSNMRTAQ